MVPSNDCPDGNYFYLRSSTFLYFDTPSFTHAPLIARFHTFSHFPFNTLILCFHFAVGLKEEH
jgi:hypothetical protein